MKDTLKIGGMSCNHCVASVQQTLSEKEGVMVEHVEVGKAVVEYDPAQHSLEELQHAVEELGFDVIKEED